MLIPKLVASHQLLVLHSIPVGNASLAVQLWKFYPFGSLNFYLLVFNYEFTRLSLCANS
ncbi:hypothetical protein M2138_000559 [Dysgonomonadaceae bacterium PH5-43]|nr:hypothetical protein [Dysgonomonadaceae bacterium PH5-43]